MAAFLKEMSLPIISEKALNISKTWREQEMIDTLKLHLSQSNTIRIENSQAEKISVTTRSNVGTGEAQLYPLATMSNGKYLDGTKAYLNTDTFQLDLTPRGAFLKFSLPKVYHGGEHNIYPIGKGGASKVFDKVEQSLADNGVDSTLPTKLWALEGF